MYISPTHSTVFRVLAGRFLSVPPVIIGTRLLFDWLTLNVPDLLLKQDLEYSQGVGLINTQHTSLRAQVAAGVAARVGLHFFLRRRAVS